ncbi:PREDICTED: uncharacterized protein LOC105359215 [Ceratosolen solmsi marchali]|uniref:Uncharacterized protein LOC105359215 n=1 Tax=Ceratosolen solmsi marchali TaxID=326594 RepID=A0AAJ6YBE5_9HYME|nr:PREDICTED: uncharacterized protein LOC105359215 [Ceratosolen solmsi marchali]
MDEVNDKLEKSIENGKEKLDESAEKAKEKLEKPTEKASDKLQRATEKTVIKSQSATKAANSKLQRATEKVIMKVPRSTRKTNNQHKESREKHFKNATSMAKPKVESKDIMDSAKNNTFTVQSAKTNSSDEELTSLFSPSTNPTFIERIQRLWYNVRGMVAIIEFWNKVRKFIKRTIGLDLP